MEIGRRCARAAIEDKGDRPFGIEWLSHMGDVENVRERLAARVAERKRGGLGAIGDFDACEADAVLADRGGRKSEACSGATFSLEVGSPLVSLGEPASSPSAIPGRRGPRTFRMKGAQEAVQS